MEEKSSKCLTVIRPNIEKWKEKEERSLRGNSGISTVSVPFEKPGEEGSYTWKRKAKLPGV